VEDASLTEWFLSKGADPNARCYLDVTPLSAAVQCAEISTIKRLSECGGTVAAGQLLHHAVWRSTTDCVEVIDFSISKGCMINSIMHSNSPQSYEQQRAFRLGTALHGAAAKGDLKVVQHLVMRGARRLVKDSL